MAERQESGVEDYLDRTGFHLYLLAVLNQRLVARGKPPIPVDLESLIGPGLANLPQEGLELRMLQWLNRRLTAQGQAPIPIPAAA